MKLNRVALAVSLAFSVTGSAFAVPPTSGAYVTDPQREWVQDRLSEEIGMPNMIMCFLGALRIDEMVNEGNYIALVDMEKCESSQRGKDDSGSTSTGASSAVNYTSVVVNSTRASSTAPMYGNAWFVPPDGGGGTPERIFARATVTESPSDTNPNGVFSVSFCGVPADRANPLAGDCDTFLGRLTGDASGLSFAENGSRGDGGPPQPYTTRLTISRDATSGSGRIASTFGGSPTVDMGFIFDANYFERGSAEPGQCFSRNRDGAKYSTWRYGVYKTDGTRLELANPGFPIQASADMDSDGTAETYWGGAGFWGVFLPDGVLSRVSTVTRKTPGSAIETTYDLTKAGGKLYRMTKVAGVLDDIKGQPLMFFLPANVVAGDTTGGQYEVNWDGAQFVAVRKQDTCGPGGCTWTDLTGATTVVTAANLRANAGWMKALQGWSQSAGGELRIDVPTSGEFLAGTVIAKRTRDVVVPGSAALTLACTNRCPKGALVADDFSTGTPFQTITVSDWGGSGTKVVSSEHSFEPVLTTNVIGYTFDTVLRSGADAVDASALSGLSGQYQHGLQSGRLLDVNSTSYTASLCESGTAYSPSPSGNSLCPWLVDDADEYFTYETGSNPWNQYVGLSSGGTPVVFDPPTNFTLDVSTTNTTLLSGDPLIGSKVQLDYNGFGELHGIPGQCVDRDTNEPVTCGVSSNNRWVPEFSIRDGAELTKGAETYYVKYLEREMRFGRVDSATYCGSLDLTTAIAATLPGAPSTADDPRGDMGAEPTVTDAPKVIHGVVQ